MMMGINWGQVCVTTILPNSAHAYYMYNIYACVHPCKCDGKQFASCRAWFPNNSQLRCISVRVCSENFDWSFEQGVLLHCQDDWGKRWDMKRPLLYSMHALWLYACNAMYFNMWNYTIIGSLNSNSNLHIACYPGIHIIPILMVSCSKSILLVVAMLRIATPTTCMNHWRYVSHITYILLLV